MTEADRYYGKAVTEYERKRQRRRSWRAEHSIVRRLISELPAGARCLDIPVGTGRFFPLYRDQGLDVVGVDISTDMIETAHQKAVALDFQSKLIRGSIVKLPFGDNAFDASICVRMTQWLEEPELDAAFGELARVTRHQIIVTVPIKSDRWLSPAAWRGHSVEKAKQARRIRRGNPVQLIHRRRWLRSCLARHGLRVAEEILITNKPGWSRYVIWVLSR